MTPNDEQIAGLVALAGDMALEAFEAWLAQRARTMASFRPADECGCPLAMWMRERAGNVVGIIVGDDMVTADFDDGAYLALGVLPDWAVTFVRQFDETFGPKANGEDIEDISVPAHTAHSFLQRIKPALEALAHDHD